MNTSFVLFGIIAVWLLTFVVGVMVAAQVKRFAAAGAVRMNYFAENVADTFNAYVEVFFCLVLPRINAAAANVVAAIEVKLDSVVDLLTAELPSTSTYHLTVSTDSAEYPAGEYLLRDNGMWRNVYLTSYARALIGTSADVIALSSASVQDSNGTARVWHVAIA